MENINELGQQNSFSNRLLNAAEVAYRLHLSRSCTYSLMQTGAIPTVHLGKSRRVRAEDLEEFILKNVHSIESTI